MIGIYTRAEVSIDNRRRRLSMPPTALTRCGLSHNQHHEEFGPFIRGEQGDDIIHRPTNNELIVDGIVLKNHPSAVVSLRSAHAIIGGNRSGSTTYPPSEARSGAAGVKQPDRFLRRTWVKAYHCDLCRQAIRGSVKEMLRSRTCLQEIR